MFKEIKGMEYALEIVRALHNNPGLHESRAIYDLMQRDIRLVASLSYVQKILPRLAKSGLLVSSETGYALSKPLAQITVDDILELCDTPCESELIYGFCDYVKRTMASVSIETVYDFSQAS